MTQPVLMPTYARLDVTFESASGAWLEDTEGQRYLDSLCGIGVTNLGHCHPAINAALEKQMQKLWHTSNLYHISAQQQLAEKLTSISGMDNAFICNSGAEANEAAIKLARLHGYNNNINNPAIIVIDGGFHGRTLATLTASSNPMAKEGFGPLVDGFLTSPLNDIDSIIDLAKNNPNIVAIFLEPIQGESGVNSATDEYLSKLHALCVEKQWLFMLDEVQTGNGRTGKYFAFQHLDFTPDVLTTAKGLGNGMPIGACLARGVASKVFQAGKHGSTFGGNPLSCAAANAVMDNIDEQLLENVNERSSQLFTGLKAALSNNKAVTAIKGKGLMIGIELDRPCAELVSLGLKAGILINVAAGKTVRLLPPLIINKEEADIILSKVVQLINSFTNNA